MGAPNAYHRAEDIDVQNRSGSREPAPEFMGGEPNVTDIGLRINALRREKDLSLGELASQAAVSKSYLSTVEKGTGTRPGAAVLHKIAQALGVTLADLIGREIHAEPLAVPVELRELASERKLPKRDVVMLAGIAFRGEAPRTKERWAFIYDAIRTSAALDNGPR